MGYPQKSDRNRIWTDAAPAAAPARSAAAEPFSALYAGLIENYTLASAQQEAVARGVAVHEILIARGLIGAERYVAALANHLGIGYLAPGSFAVRSPTGAEGRLLQAGLLRQHAGPYRILRPVGGASVVLDGETLKPAEIARIIQGEPMATQRLSLASRRGLALALTIGEGRAILKRAIWGHARRSPEDSAASGVPLRQSVRLAVIVGLVIGAAMVLPGAVVAVFTALVTLPFLAAVALRSAALPAALERKARRKAVPRSGRLRDDQLPVYTVLVPLYRERAVLHQIVNALSRLDYPPEKLDIKLVLEEVDPELVQAARRMALPPQFHIVVVPDAQPRTKPKALNYALAFARGSHLVIYDAEDVPEPDQLRRAVAGFRRGGKRLACLQAGLNIYNMRESWFTRQFTIEYSALFDALLPTLARLRLPLPLGGTSNHFRTDVLLAVGAWDPFNVTEDADLGIRLVRRGWRTDVLASTTWEEAPRSFSVWLGQRTRWLKGWMITWLVHMRSPARLRRELGLRGFIGFHAMVGGLILSALAHPIFYLLVLSELLAEWPFALPDNTLDRGLWLLATFNLVLGFGASMALGALTTRRRGHRGLAWRALWMPAYWLLISYAGWRAVSQLLTDPFRWEKTEHRGRSNGRRA